MTQPNVDLILSAVLGQEFTETPSFLKKLRSVITNFRLFCESCHPSEHSGMADFWVLESEAPLGSEDMRLSNFFWHHRNAYQMSYYSFDPLWDRWTGTIIVAV